MFQTLRVKLLVFFLLATLTPLLFLGYISYQSQKQELTKHIEQSLLTFSDEIAQEIEMLLSERISDVKHLAMNPILTNPRSSNEEIQGQFSDFLNVYDIYSDTIFVKPDGIASISFNDDIIGSNLNDRKWFQASKQGKIYLSDIYLSNVIHEPVLVMSAPVFDQQGEVIGVISPLFDLNHLWKTFNNFSEQEQMVGLNGYAFLINKNGDVIAHPDYSKILNENQLQKNHLQVADVFQNTQKIFYNKEKDVVLTYEKINYLEGFNEDWFVGISVSEAALFSPLRQLLTNYLIIIGLVLFLTMVAVIQLSKYIVSPLQRLVEATTDIAIGKPVTPLMENSYEEINRLNHTFTSMMKKLADRERGHKKSTQIIQTTDNGVIAINKQTLKITTFNRTCEKLFQLQKKDVVNQTLHAVANQSLNFREFIDSSNLLTYFKEEKTKKFEAQCRLNGETYHFFISVSSLPSFENENIHEEMLLIINDLTDKRQMEQELIRSEKLKIAGELAASLAHEIRNPLAIIRGFIQLFSKEEGAKQSYYEIIIKEIDRVNYFITDLLNIANPTAKCVSKEVNIVCLLENLLTLQQSQLSGKGIALETNLELLPTISTDPSKLQQVFINMIQNAVEAMEENGCLTISTKHLIEEKQVTISFKDTGTGMDSETIERLGTPFFTTKETGTGLGLATSYRIIEEMNGSITVSTTKNSGSIFVINLPL